jgi:hypothetical protein
MRAPKPPKPRIQKPPLNPGSMKSGMKGGSKSKLMTGKQPKGPLMGSGKAYLP